MWRRVRLRAGGAAEPDGRHPADVIDAQWAASEGAVNAAITAFEAAVKRAGISAEHRRITASVGAAGDLFGRLARRFDLAVTARGRAEERLRPG